MTELENKKLGRVGVELMTHIGSSSSLT